MIKCFNTQPPKGGWITTKWMCRRPCCFNTQPPKGGWDELAEKLEKTKVSTHSRLKAAG